MSKARRRRLYIGVDVGATKILAAVVDDEGRILSRKKYATPKTPGRRILLDAIIQAGSRALTKKGFTRKDLSAVGVAVPGVVDPDRGRVIMAPNLDLRNAKLAGELRDAFKRPVVLANDVNAGLMGEAWLGAARKAASAVAIFPGTGIGGAVLMDKHLIRGSREVAGEIGHMVLDPDGPPCGCGQRGCLEALASRTAIEREIRRAVAQGARTRLTEWLDGDLSVIKSGMLQRAVEAKDSLVMNALRDAARFLGLGCINIRHILDPDVIVLGGGVMEACGGFMLPIIRRVVAKDPVAGARKGGDVALSLLADDAVTLGAAALALERMGRDPLRRKPRKHA